MPEAEVENKSSRPGTYCVVICSSDDKTAPFDGFRRFLNTFLPLGLLLSIIVLFSGMFRQNVLFLASTALEFIDGGDRFENELEFTALLFIVAPISLILMMCGGYLYIGCGQLERGCFISPSNANYNTKVHEKRVGLRYLEWLDFVTDLISAFIIFPDFNNIWKAIIILSLGLTLVLNIYTALVLNKDNSYKGRKRKNALSFAILGAEDIIMIPLSYAYLREEVQAGGISKRQEQVETVAVAVSIGIGLILLVLRALSLCYIIGFALPDPPPNYIAEDPELNKPSYKEDDVTEVRLPIDTFESKKSESDEEKVVF